MKKYIPITLIALSIFIFILGLFSLNMLNNAKSPFNYEKIEEKYQQYQEEGKIDDVVGWGLILEKSFTSIGFSLNLFFLAVNFLFSIGFIFGGLIAFLFSIAALIFLNKNKVIPYRIFTILSCDLHISIASILLIISLSFKIAYISSFLVIMCLFVIFLMIFYIIKVFLKDKKKLQEH